MRERRSKERPVHISMRPAPRIIYVFAPRTEQLHRALPRHVGKAHGQTRLPVTHHPRTPTEIARLELLKHARHPSRRNNIARMDQPVQHLRRLLHLRLFPRRKHLVFQRMRPVCEHVQRVVVQRHLRRKTRQVETVRDVVFVDLAEELVPLDATEPRRPRRVLVKVQLELFVLRPVRRRHRRVRLRH